MSTTPAQPRPGDVVNGHVLTEGGQWVPVTPAPQPPAKKKHTVRNVILALLLVGLLVIGGCLAMLGGAANEIDKALDEEAQNDVPTEVVEGAAFEHDGYAVAKGWKVAPEEFGGATIQGLEITLTDDQDLGGRSAMLTFRLYDGSTVVSEIECSSNEMQEGETSRVDCFSLDSEKLGAWDTIKVSDMW